MIIAGVASRDDVRAICSLPEGTVSAAPSCPAQVPARAEGPLCSGAAALCCGWPGTWPGMELLRTISHTNILFLMSSLAPAKLIGKKTSRIVCENVFFSASFVMTLRDATDEEGPPQGEKTPNHLTFCFRALKRRIPP